MLVKRINVNDLSDVCGRETNILRLWLSQFNEDFFKSIMKSLLSKEASLGALGLKRISLSSSVHFLGWYHYSKPAPLLY